MLSKAKDELEAEKRELVRTLERRSLEVENLNGMKRSFLYNFICIASIFVNVKSHLYIRVISFALPDDLRQLNDKLVEVNSSKMTLQMKLDDLEAAEVNIKVS